LYRVEVYLPVAVMKALSLVFSPDPTHARLSNSLMVSNEDPLWSQWQAPVFQNRAKAVAVIVRVDILQIRLPRSSC
jgi:hypothetical protein